MKKIYSIFALLIAGLVSMAASAESRTVTFHIDDPDGLIKTISDNSNASTVFTPDDNNSFEAVFNTSPSTGEVKTIKFELTSPKGIISVADADGNQLQFEKDTYSNPVSNKRGVSTFAGAGYSYQGFSVKDGGDVYVTVSSLTDQIFTFVGDPDHMEVVYNDNYDYKYNQPVEQKEAGVWELDVTAGGYSPSIKTKGDYLIQSITYGDDNTEVKNCANKTSVSITCSEYTGNTTFTVTLISKEDARTASFTLKILNGGDIKDILVKRAGTAIELEEADEQTIKFNPAIESSISISRVSGRKIYAATHTYMVTTGEGDEKTEEEKSDKFSSTNTVSFSATDGSVLEIDADFPEVKVPVLISFKDVDNACLSGVKVNGTALEDEAWLAEDFSVMLSDMIELNLDSDKYEFKSNCVTVNGKGYSTTYSNPNTISFEVLEEKDQEVVITARKYVDYNITIYCDAWEYCEAQVYYTQNWNPYYIPVPLTAAETTFSVSEKTAERLDFKIKDAFKSSFTRKSITDFETGDELDYSWGANNGQVKKLFDGLAVVVNVEKNRKETAHIYLEDTNWDATEIALDFDNAFEEVYELEPGKYTQVTFAKPAEDVPNDFTGETFYFLTPAEGTLVYYLNGEKLELDDEEMPQGIENIKDGDVVKIYSSEQTPVTVKYTIAEGVNATVAHDYVVAVENPDEHEVLPGTHILITPVATTADEAADETETTATLPIKVTANDTAVTPEENGTFLVVAKDNTDIKIEKNTSVGISEISADKASDAAYDLQGRRVAKNTKGLVIENGKLQIRK